MSRPCVERISKKNPDSYSKDELVILAIEKLGKTKSEANKLSKQELCIELKLISDISSERGARSQIHKTSKKRNIVDSRKKQISRKKKNISKVEEKK